MNPDMNRRLMYTSVKTVKAALTEVFVQSLNMGRMVQRNENWLSHKKKVNEILHTEKYHELMKQRSVECETIFGQTK